jgi:hypothetical protein
MTHGTEVKKKRRNGTGKLHSPEQQCYLNQFTIVVPSEGHSEIEDSIIQLGIFHETRGPICHPKASRICQLVA